MKAWRRLNSSKFVRDFDKKTLDNSVLGINGFENEDGTKAVFLACPKHKRKTMFKSEDKEVSNLFTVLMFNAGFLKLPAGASIQATAVI